MPTDRHLLERVRSLVMNRERFIPRTDRSELPQVGDIRLIRALSSQAQRLALVLRVFGEFNYAEVCLLSNEIDMASDFDALLSREETDLPFDLIAELDLTAPVFLVQAGSWFSKLRSEDLLRQLQGASVEDVEKIGPGMRGQPIQGQADPRWKYKEKELTALQELSRECTYSLVEGKTEMCTVIDPVLLDEVISQPEDNPLEISLGLVAISEAAQGGIASADQIDCLLTKFEDLFEMDPTLQMAAQPLLEAAISLGEPAPFSGSAMNISNRNPRIDELELEFSRLLTGSMTDQCGPILRVVTTESAWTKRLDETTPIPIDIPGHGLVYADARDPRRAA